MAAFNFQELSPRLTLPELIQKVGSTFQNLALVLKGIRKEGDGRMVFDHELEVEDDGKGVILSSPDGTRYRLSVSNAGATVWTAL